MKAKAKVVLRGAKTYTFGGRRWIKDVPGVVSGDAVALYKQNGYFRVSDLKVKKSSKSKGDEGKEKGSGKPSLKK